MVDIEPLYFSDKKLEGRKVFTREAIHGTIFSTRDVLKIVQIRGVKRLSYGSKN
ncbi:hypothetical protein [Peptoniphilus sp. EMRHCC_23]|uniref:hypothetical protein n=1 Tax=Peptoniphilus rachelemmaiella TaxID=2811779 RepID=UPI001BFFDF44|nr:hypothetical protein [Peptoniphilus rachelemmaiella]